MFGLFPSSYHNLVEAWDLSIWPARSRLLFRVSLLATSWTIWKGRNTRCFEGKSSSADALVDKIKFSVVEWVSPDRLLRVLLLELS